MTTESHGRNHKIVEKECIFFRFDFDIVQAAWHNGNYMRLSETLERISISDV